MPEYFSPLPKNRKSPLRLNLYLGKENLEKRIRVAAANADLSVSEFCRQCIIFALDNMLEKTDG